jgi:8-oxo-dGTP diphosphatase
VLNDKGMVLFGLRKGGLGDGEWSLPAGHIEFGESILQAGLREVKEETGLVVSEPELVSVADEIYDNTHYVGFGITALYRAGEPKLMEPEKCSEWRWFDINALPDNLFKATRMVMKNYLSKKIYTQK